MTDTPRLELLPAVDVADGQAVRLTQGAAGTETGYGDPLAAARDWVDGGAEWIHLVDLDAAFGRGSNAELLARVVGEVPVSIEPNTSPWPSAPCVQASGAPTSFTP